MRYIAVVSLLVATMSAQNAPSTNKGRHLDIPAISREANGAVVSIIMADNKGQPITQGSGFVVTRNGLVVTNYHVIKSGTSAVIKLPDGSFFTVEGVLAFDKDHDIAVIKAHGTNFKTVAWGDSDRLQVGDEVVAIGSPLSLESTVSNGIVSGFRTEKRNIFDEMAPQGGQKLLQITAPISHGSSGGPLFNMAGEVVGITSAALVGGESLNFAVPINDVKPMLAWRLSKASAFAFPNEPENDPHEPQEHASAQDPIILDEDGATGFAEVFDVEPACAGLTLMRPENAAEVYRPPARAHWIISMGTYYLQYAYDPSTNDHRTFLSWRSLVHYTAHEHDCTIGGVSKQCQDVDKHLEVYALLKGSRDAERIPDWCDACTTTTPASLDAGVKAVCTLVKGGGGGQVK